MYSAWKNGESYVDDEKLYFDKFGIKNAEFRKIKSENKVNGKKSINTHKNRVFYIEKQQRKCFNISETVLE